MSDVACGQAPTARGGAAIAACGVAVVKHGNRGITSKCGGADVLEALGVRIDLPNFLKTDTESPH